MFYHLIHKSFLFGNMLAYGGCARATPGVEPDSTRMALRQRLVTWIRVTPDCSRRVGIGPALPGDCLCREITGGPPVPPLGAKALLQLGAARIRPHAWKKPMAHGRRE